MHTCSASCDTLGKQNSVQKKTFKFPICMTVGYVIILLWGFTLGKMPQKIMNKSCFEFNFLQKNSLHACLYLPLEWS